MKKNQNSSAAVYRCTKHPIMRIVPKSGTKTSYRPPTFLIGVEDYQSTYSIGTTKGSFFADLCNYNGISDTIIRFTVGGDFL